MWVAQTIEDLRSHRRRMGNDVCLVATMGAMHAGHLSLVAKARTISQHVIVSIFVNPIQFGPHEDFQRYPRDTERDLEACRQAGADGVFGPGTEQMYPAGVPECQIDVPGLTNMLEGEIRPNHFGGVCRVVMKLLHLTQPRCSCFGMKDYQQLRVVEAMAADVNLPIMIVGCETVRDEDGLALSSRNEYLDGDQRRRATGLYKSLCEARMLMEDAGETDPLQVENLMRQVLMSHRVDIQYAVVRHPMTLTRMDSIDLDRIGAVALVAGMVGEVRLIDNVLHPHFQMI